MKKVKVIAFVLVMLLAMCLFTACSGVNYPYGPIAGGPEVSAEVINNQGFVIQKGDYYYFINGQAVRTDDNTFGKVEKGAIMRVKVDGSDEPVVIVPKIVLSGNTEVGFTIIDDRIYYASPSNKFDQNNVSLRTRQEFYSCKLDGTDTKLHLTIRQNTPNYRFYKVDNKVNLIYESESAVNICDLSKGDSSLTTYVGYYTNTAVFGDDGVYFTVACYPEDENGNENTDANACDYNKIMKMKPNGDIDEYLSGDGESDKFVFNLLCYRNGRVYYTKSSLRLNPSLSAQLCSSTNLGADEKIHSNGSVESSSDFVTYTDNGNIVTFLLSNVDSTYNISYIPTVGADYTDGIKKLVSSTNSLTLIGVYGQYFYYYEYVDSTYVLMRVDYKAILAQVQTEGEAEQILPEKLLELPADEDAEEDAETEYDSLVTSFMKYPQLLNGKIFYFSKTNDSYLYSFDVESKTIALLGKKA